jgi:hypothetical protein
MTPRFQLTISRYSHLDGAAGCGQYFLCQPVSKIYAGRHRVEGDAD